MTKFRRVKSQPFVHLHNHTEFSFLDALPKVKGLGKVIRAKGFKSYAITDHGNICGVYHFVKDLQGAGVKPIVGCEFYYVPDRHRKGLTPEERAEAKATGEGPKQMESRLELRKSSHVVVLAKSNKGWRKLVRALEVAHSEGFYYRPRIDMEVLADMAPDVVVTTACIGGVASRLVLGGRWDEAVKWSSEMVSHFGDDFYLEIQPNEMEDQVKLNPWLIELSEETGANIVATCDVHYIEREDWETHDVMLAIRDSVHGKRVLVSDPDRFRYTTHELWLKSYRDVIQSFERFHPDIPAETIKRAARATLEIDAKIEPEVLRERYAVLPQIEIEDDFEGDPDAKLWALIRHGWKWRKITKRTKGCEGVIDWIDGETPTAAPLVKVYEARVRHEMETIVGQGFSKYFLVLHDLIWWCRDRGIRVGPGRGSVGGSIVGYLLGITSVDSIKYRCPFSRFISPDRIDFPDIDTDFPTSERAAVKQYLAEKYGPDFVASICTFSKLKGKAVLKDCGRVFDVPYIDTDKVTQYVIERAEGDERATDCLQDSIKDSPELREYASQYPQVIRHATKLEGNIRQMGVNAAGVVVSDEPLREMIPVQFQHKYNTKGGKLGDYVTGWEKRAVESVGLLKLDILGIEGLTYIQRTLDLIHERHGVRIEPEEWEELNDPEVFLNFCEGNTELVWQMNTFTTIRVLKRLKPEHFDHLVATTALIRPGPMNAGITDTYIKRRHGQKTKSLHPLLDEILETTYGLFVYQEDVIKVCHDLGGFTWAEADKIRKDVGKKKGVEYLQRTYVEKFCEGSASYGVNRETAVRIWDMISEFGMYGFNRAHATAYTMLSYWTMWLKVHYPIEFMTAALEAESDQTKRNLYIREAKRLGLRVIGPDVNVSGFSYSIDPNEDNVIRAGFIDIKGVGEKAVTSIVETAPFESLRDFLDRCKANKTVVKNLLKVGAFDSLTDEPWTILGNLDAVLKVRRLKRKDQYWEALELDQVDPWTPDEVERNQLDLLGLPPEVHPAERAAKWLKRRTNHFDVHTLAEYGDLFPHYYSNSSFAFCGVIEKVKFYPMDVTDWTDPEQKVFRKRIARINIADDTGTVAARIGWRQVEDLGTDALKVGEVLFMVARAEGYLKLSPNIVVNMNQLKAKLKAGGPEPGTPEWWVMNDPFNEGLREALFDTDRIRLIGEPKRNRRKRTAIYVLDTKMKKISKGIIMSVTGMDFNNVVRTFLVWATDVPIFGRKFQPGSWLTVCVKTRVFNDQDRRFSFESRSVDGAGSVMDLGRYLEKYGDANG